MFPNFLNELLNVKAACALLIRVECVGWVKRPPRFFVGGSNCKKGRGRLRKLKRLTPFLFLRLRNFNLSLFGFPTGLKMLEIRNINFFIA